jgi:hypothetical protein
VAPVIEGDWLASVCPYLASEDGTYRSAAPDAGHRCMAQDPPATLPLAFQERFCLTDRHPRCEMYKFAQGTAVGGSVPVDQVQAATRSTSAASDGGGAGNRRAIMAAAGLGGAAVVVLVLVLLLGSCSSDPAVAPDDGASPDPQATQQPEPTPKPTPKPTPEAETKPEATPIESEAPQDPGIVILYEVQEGERLLKIAETFGVTRKRVIKANEGMEDKQPYVAPGDIIIVPVSSEMTIDEIEAVPGYQGPAE